MRRLWRPAIPLAFVPERMRRRGHRGAIHRLAISIAILTAACGTGGLSPSRADTPDASRIDALESRLREIQRLYEARITALEKEVAELKTVRAPAPGTAVAGATPPTAPVPAAPPPTAAAPPAGAPAGAPSEASTAPTAGAAPSALEAQLARELGATAAPPGTAAPAPPPAQPWSPAQPITIAGGNKNYLNLSFDTLVAGGTSTAPDISSIQTGGHDPAQRGFTAQNIEMVLDGAVDPYFRGQGNVVLQIGPGGETNVELEEAYLVSTSLPANLQAKAGMYFSEFGRLNAQHPHTWDFVDQPLVNGRFLGPDGLRNPGARLSWLMPVHCYSELFLSVQDSQGETAASFRGEPGETFAGHPIASRDVRSMADLLYVPRWTGSFDLTSNQTLLAGASAALGPNGTGDDTSTRIYGVDFFWKWKAPNAQAGFPFVKWQTEGMWRRYEAAESALDTNDDGTADLFLPHETLEDRGAYSQVLWGFTRNWVAGLRGDYVTGDDGALDEIETDPARRTRWRVSSNLTWYPTEYSKFRLQWNHDRQQEDRSDDSLWLQFEFLLGAHAAHKF